MPSKESLKTEEVFPVATPGATPKLPKGKKDVNIRVYEFMAEYARPPKKDKSHHDHKSKGDHHDHKSKGDHHDKSSHGSHDKSYDPSPGPGVKEHKHKPEHGGPARKKLFDESGGHSTSGHSMKSKSSSHHKNCSCKK